MEKAKILFVGSNPGIDFNEHYPTKEWSVSDIVNFHNDRFDIGIETTRNGKHVNKWCNYWRNMNKWATWILQADGTNFTNNTAPLSEYSVMTEVVHCKSTNQQGVSACLSFCAKKWMQQILALFDGNYIILVGKIAEQIKQLIETILKNQNKLNVKIASTYHPAAPVRGMTDEKRKNLILTQLGLI